MSERISHFEQIKTAYSTAFPFLGPICTGSVGIVSYVPFLAWKSALQTERQPPKLISREIAALSLRSAPTAGFAVGSQLAAQSLLRSTTGAEPDDRSVWASLCVGSLSAPGLIMLNGQSIQRTALDSLRSMHLRQVGSVAGRETLFLYSLDISGPVAAEMKERLGESKSVEHSCTFIVGAFGGASGHLFDSYLTRLQRGMCSSWRSLMLGFWPRTAGVGLFSVVYTETKKAITPN